MTMTVNEALAIVLDIARRHQENNASLGHHVPSQDEAISVATAHTLMTPEQREILKLERLVREADNRNDTLTARALWREADAQRDLWLSREFKRITDSYKSSR